MSVTASWNFVISGNPANSQAPSVVVVAKVLTSGDLGGGPSFGCSSGPCTQVEADVAAIAFKYWDNTSACPVDKGYASNFATMPNPLTTGTTTTAGKTLAWDLSWWATNAGGTGLFSNETNANFGAMIEYFQTAFADAAIVQQTTASVTGVSSVTLGAPASGAGGAGIAVLVNGTAMPTPTPTPTPRAMGVRSIFVE